MDNPPTSVKAQLRQAYSLIKAEQKSEAYELLTPIVASSPELIDAWWLAAFAAPTPRHAAFACQKVLALNPNHWPAKHFLEDLRRQITAAQHSATPLKPVKHQRGRIRLWMVILLISIPLLIGAGFVITVSLTGNTYGLPIASLYNAEYTINVPLVDLTGDGGITSGSVAGLNLNRTGTTQAGSLVVGSDVRYTFVGKANTIFFATIDFASLRDEKPGKAFQLLNGQGRVLASATTASGLTQISALIPSNGNYTIRLTGVAGQAQGPYLMTLAAASAELD